jgi:hypothetical protein
MGSYEARLERVEAAIAPKEVLYVVFVRDGETNEQALARCGIATIDRTPVLFLAGADAAL